MSNTVKIVIGAIVIIAFVALMLNLGGAPAGGTDTSDETLKNDAAAFDAELQGLEEDRAVIDEGLETDVSAE